ncbi:CHRD domain-containing protein [Phenylobacterium sp.]|uniref:CHRD domain-containing protein n=1 Tax=Phenylobacterium sp. TaxID=1871053 RepID=UPI002DEEFB55|nr:CHRD domain-containing protein [Phenylobacterium sp.]
MRYLVIGAAMGAGLGLGLVSAAAAAETTLSAKLGGADASGMAKVRVDDKNQVCWDLTSKGLTEVTAAHIHKGAAGANGPPVVPFTGVDATGASKGCAAASADVAKDLVANPAGYYVNVHTKAAPAGAIRGQLGK